jgi:hypothetical protein
MQPARKAANHPRLVSSRHPFPPLHPIPSRLPPPLPEQRSTTKPRTVIAPRKIPDAPCFHGPIPSFPAPRKHSTRALHKEKPGCR